MDLKRTAIAIHETGHAIMAVIFKQKIEKLSLKEMIAPNGTDKYLGSMTLVPSAEKSKFTGKEVIQKIMISLGGYASETLFFEDTGKFFGSDLNTAIKWTETLMLEVEFRKWAVTLPPPTTDVWDFVENPTARAYIHLKMKECVDRFIPLKADIRKVAEELLRKEELSGDEILRILELQ